MRKAKLEFFKNAKEQWCWHFTSPNGKIIAYSGESYTRRTGAVKGWNSLFGHIAKHSYITLNEK